jgi:hypothetical protein
VYDPSSYKSIEWQQLSMYAFHIIIACLEEHKRAEKSTILAFAFLARAMRLPDAEYEQIPESMLDRASEILIMKHEEAFGPTAGTYNFHIVSCHLKFLRECLGCFTDVNAYDFESSYGDIRRSFIPGTRKLEM